MQLIKCNKYVGLNTVQYKHLYIRKNKNTAVIHLTYVIQQMCFMTRKITLQTGHNPFSKIIYSKMFIFSSKHQIIEKKEVR